MLQVYVDDQNICITLLSATRLRASPTAKSARQGTLTTEDHAESLLLLCPYSNELGLVSNTQTKDRTMTTKNIRSNANAPVRTVPAPVPTKPMSITHRLKELTATVPAIIRAGNVDEVTLTRKQIVNLLTEVKVLRRTFDKSLLAAQNGFAGDDFLKGIEPIVKPGQGRKPNAKPEVNEDEYL